MARLSVAAVVVMVVLMLVMAAAGAPDVEYAELRLDYENGEVADERTFTGVFAGYGPIESVRGLLVPASPSDACSPLRRPSYVPQNVPIIFIAQLTGGSNCTYLDQGLHAQAAGAVGLVNMAVQHSSYIYPLEMTTAEKARKAQAPRIPSVAISGNTGRILLSAISRADLYLSMNAPEDPRFSPFVVDITIGLIIITLTGLVLLALYHGGRWAMFKSRQRLLAMREQQELDRVLDTLPVRRVRNAKPENEEDQDVCAVCLDAIDRGCVVRTLPCSHEFHKDCIDPWLREKLNCPLCKLEVSTSSAAADEDAEDDSQRQPQPQQHRSTADSPVRARLAAAAAASGRGDVDVVRPFAEYNADDVDDDAGSYMGDDGDITNAAAHRRRTLQIVVPPPERDLQVEDLTDVVRHQLAAGGDAASEAELSTRAQAPSSLGDQDAASYMDATVLDLSGHGQHQVLELRNLSHNETLA